MSQLSSSRRISLLCWLTRIFPVLSKRFWRLISPSSGRHHITHRREEDDCHIISRIFKPISGHPLILFITNVVNQGISHPIVGSVLLLESLLLLLSLDLTILQRNFVVSSYAIKIFLQANSALFLLVLCFFIFCYFGVSVLYPSLFYLLLQTYLFYIFYIVHSLYCSRSSFPLPLGGILKGNECSLLDYRGWVCHSLGLTYSFYCSSLSRCLFMTGKTLLTLTLPGFLLTRYIGSIIRDLFFLRPRKWHTTPILVKISSPQLSREEHLPTPLFWPSVTQVPFKRVNCIAISISGTSYFNRLITLSLKH